MSNFDEVLKYNENSAIVYFYKGIIYHNLGEEINAFNNYTKAIEIDKKMIDAYFNRGQLLINSEPKKALDDFVTAVALDSKFIDAYYSIAVIQRKLGQYKEAIDNLDKIIEIKVNKIK